MAYGRGRDRGYEWAQPMNSHLPKLIQLSCLWPSKQSGRHQRCSPKWHYSLRRTNHLVSTWHWIPLVPEGLAIHYHKDTHLSGISRSQSHKASASITILALMECLTHRCESHATVFIWGPTSQQGWENVPRDRTHWSLSHIRNPEIRSPIDH